MKHCAIQQNAFAACEEMRKNTVSFTVSLSGERETVFCPKPRRLGLLDTAMDDPIRPLRWRMSYQTELYDQNAGSELMDIILPKDGYGVEQSVTQVASSPPFFCGSPPSRVSNPVVQDTRFREEKVSPVSPRSIPFVSGLSSSPSSSARKGAFVRANFGNKPVTRIEGFDCLDRDRRNRSVSALA